MNPLTIIFCAALVALTRANANLITNSGFENTSTVLSDWHFTDSGGVHVADGLDPSHSGTQLAYVNAYPGYGTISQDVATIPGVAYLIEFWVASNGGDGNIYASFGSTVGYMEGPSTTDLNSPNFTYRFRSFQAIAADVITTFTFGGYGITATYFLDDVSITRVPEMAGTLPLLAFAMLGTLGLSKLSMIQAHGRLMAR